MRDAVVGRRGRVVEEAKGASRFALVGVAATLVHLLFAQTALALAAPPVGANAVGFAFAFGVGFFGHQFFSFAGKAPFWRALKRYGVIAFCGFIANLAIMAGALTFAPDWIALGVAILAVPAGTFLASRFWGFQARS